MDKRTFLKNSLLIGTGTMVGFHTLAGNAIVSSESAGDGSFVLPELKYDFNALEPYIDAQTMELHHARHHAGYTRKFNTALKEAGINETDVKKIFKNISSYPDAVKNNGGGYFNHKLFWEILTPNGSGKPSGNLLEAINSAFGSFENFKEKYSIAAASVFGSGWAWLVEKKGKLEIAATSNQDNPLMDIAETRGKPIMNIDVWEHAYYLKYQNKRKEYIKAYWNIVNWKQVAKNLSE